MRGFGARVYCVGVMDFDHKQVGSASVPLARVCLLCVRRSICWRARLTLTWLVVLWTVMFALLVECRTGDCLCFQSLWGGIWLSCCGSIRLPEVSGHQSSQSGAEEPPGGLETVASTIPGLGYLTSITSCLSPCQQCLRPSAGSRLTSQEASSARCVPTLLGRSLLWEEAITLSFNVITPEQLPAQLITAGHESRPVRPVLPPSSAPAADLPAVQPDTQTSQ